MADNKNTMAGRDHHTLFLLDSRKAAGFRQADVEAWKITFRNFSFQLKLFPWGPNNKQYNICQTPPLHY